MRRRGRPFSGPLVVVEAYEIFVAETDQSAEHGPISAGPECGAWRRAAAPDSRWGLTVNSKGGIMIGGLLSQVLGTVHGLLGSVFGILGGLF